MAEFNQIFTQKIIDMLKKSTWTSASPDKTNFVKDINAFGFGADFDQAFEAAMIEAIQEFQSQNVAEKSSTISEEGVTGGTSIPLSTPLGAASTISSTATKTLLGRPDILMEMARKFPPAAIAFLAASMAPLIFKYITRPGSELDLRYIRNINEEQNALLSRQQQYDTAAGFRGVIATSTIDGFLAVNGANNENTLRLFREGTNFYGKLNDITNEHNAKGFYS